jgi:hypothetical protein
LKSWDVSTGVKNHDYPDTLYVSDLIAPDTVNTLPEKTLKAYADHGSPGTPIQKTYHEAAQVMKAVADAGVDLDDVFKGHCCIKAKSVFAMPRSVNERPSGSLENCDNQTSKASVARIYASSMTSSGGQIA